MQPVTRVQRAVLWANVVLAGALFIPFSIMVPAALLGHAFPDPEPAFDGDPVRMSIIVARAVAWAAALAVLVPTIEALRRRAYRWIPLICGWAVLLAQSMYEAGLFTANDVTPTYVVLEAGLALAMLAANARLLHPAVDAALVPDRATRLILWIDVVLAGAVVFAYVAMVVESFALDGRPQQGFDGEPAPRGDLALNLVWLVAAGLILVPSIAALLRRRFAAWAIVAGCSIFAAFAIYELLLGFQREWHTPYLQWETWTPVALLAINVWMWSRGRRATTA